MMNVLEEAIVYATNLLQGKVRELSGIPLILHSMEVAQILSTMTDDMEIITAGILHDVVCDADELPGEIEKRFGNRIARLVALGTEKEISEMLANDAWRKRREDALETLQKSTDVGVKMLWLADTLSNLRTYARIYSERGDALWTLLRQSDPAMHGWYYRTFAETIELSLNKTGAFKELIKHVNYIWPGTFDSEKTKYRNYREVSIDGCKLLGRGAKGEVYRYDDELVIKVFNQNNTYRDIEREIALSRRAFVLGLPTAISFGIVSVGERYGAMFELLRSETISMLIAKSPGQVDGYAKIMARLAHEIHEITVSEGQIFPPASERINECVQGGLARENELLAQKCMELVEALPATNHVIHGDFHTGNVFLQDGEPVLIDLDKAAIGRPVIELSDLYYFYVILGEDDPSEMESFMGFSCQVAKQFMDDFLRYYLRTDDEERIAEVKEKISLLGYARLIRRLRRIRAADVKTREKIGHCLAKISELVEKIDDLDLGAGL